MTLVEGAMVGLIVVAFVFMFKAYNMMYQVVQLEREDKRRIETQLLATLGKTDVVAITAADHRSPGKVRYIGDDEAIALAKERGRGAA